MSELETLRTQIDAIDRQLTELFLQRMAVTQQVGEYKLRNGIPVLDVSREQQVLAAKAAMAPNEASKRDVVQLYEAIMGISRRLRHFITPGSRWSIRRWFIRGCRVLTVRWPVWTSLGRMWTAKDWSSLKTHFWL